MRIQDLQPQVPQPKTVLNETPAPTQTVQRLLETADDKFSKPMTGKELMEWVNSL